jgi:tetratricopeptide (TPR) repeat protein
MESDLSQLTNDPLAIPVLTLMREGRWRKARDAAKDLCKRDRGRYLALLIEANIGLVRELLGKGLAKDATTVVAYLDTIAPPAVVAALRIELATPVVKQTAPEPGNADRALGWAAMLRADAAVSAGAAIAPADLAEIDLLVADTYWPPTATNEEPPAVLKQLAAVRAACEATGDGQWEKAQELLREVPGQSVFRHWRMFLRGVRCFFQDQPDPARQCFAGLPPDGALARAARALAPEWVPPGPLAPATARVPLGLAMTGQPAAWAGPMLAAGTAWKTGKRVKAFEELNAGMKGLFPGNDPGLPALLTTALVPFRERMSDQDCRDADQLSERFDMWDERRFRSAPDSALAILRPMCLAEWDSMGPGQLESSWGKVIELWNRCHGSNPLRDSLAWQWLGEAYLKHGVDDEPFGPFGPSGTCVDFKRARKALDKAVECDPANEPAWLALLELLQQQGDSKTRNRLLDDLAKRFPNNKTILLETGTQAVERKAFDKGLVALRAALALDPLDRNVKEKIVIALVLQIREFTRRCRPVAPLWADIEPLLEDRTDREHFMLARWMARVRRALLDRDPEPAQAAFDDAVRLAPSALDRLFLERMLAGVYGEKLRKSWQQDWQHAKQAGDLKWATLIRVFDYHAHVTNIKEWDHKMNRHAETLAVELCTCLIVDDLKLDPEGTLAFADHLDHLAKKTTHQAKSAGTKCLKLFLGALKKVTDPKRQSPDLRLRLCGFLMDERQAAPRVTATEKLFKSLAALVAEAEAAGMPNVVARAHALRTRWEQRAAREAERRNTPPAHFDEDWDDGDDDWDFDVDDDEDDEDVDDFVDRATADPNMAEMFELMIDLEVAVLTQNQKNLDNAIKKLRKFGMPEAAIKEVIAEIEGRGSFMPGPQKPKPQKPAKSKPIIIPPTPAKPPPAPKPPKPPKPPPAVDPNQLDLF